MCASARTAPKSARKDFVSARILFGEVLNRRADDMVAYGEASGKKNFDHSHQIILDASHDFFICEY